MENGIENKIEEKQIQEKKVKVFYFNHLDGFEKLSPILLVDGEKIWQIAMKKKFNNTKMYYILYSDRSYLKLWKDSKDNLLYFVDNYHGHLFYSGNLDVWKFSVICPDFEWDNESLTFDNIRIKFNVPILNIVRQLDITLSTPTAYVIYKLYSNSL
jgi:hypothetical protein